jgi:uncharacterized protein YjbJ (UPF0337 family)
MGERFDEAKGQAKEAAGDVTDDEALQREGKVDQTKSSIKAKVDDLGDKVKNVLGRGREKERDRS